MRKPSLVLRAVLAASLASPALPSPEHPVGRAPDADRTLVFRTWV